MLADKLRIVLVLRMSACTPFTNRTNSMYSNMNIFTRYYSFCWEMEDNKKPMRKGGRLKEALDILCKESRLKEAVDLLPIFRQRGMRLDPTTYGNLLKVCIKMKAFEEGKRVHTHMIQSEFQPGVFLSNRLVDLYVKSRSLVTARELFDKMPERDSCSWNTMIAGYAKCGNLDEARKLLDKMPERGPVSWTSIIAGYVQNGRGREALDLFSEMQGVGVESDQVTYASVLSACASLATLLDAGV